MVWAPLLAAPLLVQLHLAAGLGALLTGAMRLIWPRTDQADVLLGWSFLVLLVFATATAVFLPMPPDSPNLGGVTLGHGFTVFAVLGVAAAVVAARRGNRLVWRKIVTATFAGVLLMAGLFEMLPGRLLNTVLAGG